MLPSVSGRLLIYWCGQKRDDARAMALDVMSCGDTAEQARRAPKLLLSETVTQSARAKGSGSVPKLSRAHWTTVEKIFQPMALPPRLVPRVRLRRDVSGMDDGPCRLVG